MWNVHEIQIFGICKDLLGTTMLIHLMYDFPQLLCATKVKLGSCNRVTWLTKSKIFTIWHFTEKVCNKLKNISKKVRQLGQIRKIHIPSNRTYSECISNYKSIKSRHHLKLLKGSGKKEKSSTKS